MKIAIIGTGGIGAYYGSRLIADGQEVHFVATERHVTPVRERGLVAHTEEHGEGVFEPASITTDPADIGVVDIVLVTVKLYQLEVALQGAEALIGPDTLVFSTQNGVTAPEILASRFGRDHVVTGICFILAFLEGPGEVRQKGARPGFTVGAHTLAQSDDTPYDVVADAPDPRIQALIDSLVRAGVAATIDPNIQHAQWVKFALIATFGGVCGLADTTIGEIRGYEPTRALLRQSLDEVRALAHARGITLTDADLEEIMRRFMVQDPGGTTSMQRDIAEGKPSELDELNGAVVAMAKESGVPVPFHSIALAVLGMRAARASRAD